MVTVMAESRFKKATKKALKARIALCGPAGSGKTWTALVTAQALAEGGRIAVIDTERGSASLYSDTFDFDTVAPNSFNPRDLISLLAEAGAEGYEVVLIDSLSHFWMGTDGMLEQVDKAGRRSGGGNSFAGWKEVRPMERELIDAMLAYPGHVIATMRTKTEWVVEENDRGKKVPRKIGLKPEQRDGLEYEFSICGDIDHDHALVITKSRCSALAGQVIDKPDATFGKTILAWLQDGAEALTATEYLTKALAAEGDIPVLQALRTQVEGAGQLGAAVIYGAESRRLGDVLDALIGHQVDPDADERAELLKEIGALADAHLIPRVRVAALFSDANDGRNIKSGTPTELQQCLADLTALVAEGAGQVAS